MNGIEGERPVARSSGGQAEASWFDLGFVLVLVAVGFRYLGNPRGWAPNVYIGNQQWGDADFWWQGGLQFAQGIVWDNLNFTFRMGYAAFAGLVTAVVGPHYSVFHAILTLVFLGLAAAAYLALKGRVGRPVAAAMAAILVFSPMQGEWLAISTSDGLGMMLNIAALLALMGATRAGAGLGSPLLAGLFIALAGLTRPLMTLFIAPATLIVLAYTGGRPGRRMRAVIMLLGAFGAPTLGWMSALDAKTGAFALAGHDASIFYAASTQTLQTWSSDAYTAIKPAVTGRYGPAPTVEQQNAEFRRQTWQNYEREWRYHLRRLGGTLRRVAGFSHGVLKPADHVERPLRLLLYGGVGLILIVGAAVARRPILALGLAAAIFLSLWPPSAPWLVTAFAAWFLLGTGRASPGPVHRIIACYWLAGLAAMFLTGGVWKPSGATSFTIDPLGYRLGAQFLFCDDWLVLLGLGALAGRRALTVPPMMATWFAARPLPRRALNWAGAVSLGMLTLLCCSGAVIAGSRGLKLAFAVHQPMPPLAPVVAALCRDLQAGRPRADRLAAEPAAALVARWGEDDPTRRMEGTGVFTGAVGGLLWNLDGRDRTRALFHVQPAASPYIVSAIRTHVEFERAIDEDAWRDRQGAFFVRNFREEASHTGIVYRESLPQVQLFVPLAPDGRAFDLARTERFPLARYASALLPGLTITGGVLEWWAFPISDTRRWFVIQPPAGAPPVRTVAIDLDLRDAVGKKTLSFDFRVEPFGYVPTTHHVGVRIDVVGRDGTSHEVMARDTLSRGAFSEGTPAARVSADLAPDAVSVRVSFPEIDAREYIRITEFKLASEDVVPTFAQQFCTGAPDDTARPG